MFKQIRYVVAATFLLTLPHPTVACLNDRDTLASEAQRRPDVLRAITGRFERNPPLYYDMRIARLKVELARNPAILSDYDDIAVALDRRGFDEEAIRWIDRKVAVLPAITSSDPNITEAWYRYYANSGTFHVHLWIHNGASPTQFDDLTTARDQIAEAIAIKPDAHFGREKYQLKVIDWLIKTRVKGSSETLAAALENAPDDECATALAGLITLGNAWESVDIYEALENKLGEKDHALADFARLRALELVKIGHKPLVSDEDDADAMADHLIARAPYIREQYDKQRAEADRWQAARTQYMLGLLEQGRHPDTDPTFWNGWHDSGPPAIVRPPGQYDGLKRLVDIVSFTVIALIGLALAAVVVRRQRRERSSV